MNDLFKIDVSAQQGTVAPISQGRITQSVSQDLGMLGASQIFDLYFRDITKDIVDDYNSVFDTTIKEFAQNTTTIGSISVQYNRAALGQEFIRKIKKSTQNYDITFQKPKNDLELYEWAQGFEDDVKLKGVSTKDENFATGFCLIHDAWENGVPFSDTSRYEWSSKLAQKASDQNLKDMYVFIPSSNRGEDFVRNGITFHFIPTSNHKLSVLSQKVQDNMGVENNRYADNRLTSPNSFHLTDIKLGTSASEHFLMNAKEMTSGENRFNETTIAEGLIGEAIDYIIGKTQSINTDVLVAKSPFTFLFR